MRKIIIAALALCGGAGTFAASASAATPFTFVAPRVLAPAQVGAKYPGYNFCNKPSYGVCGGLVGLNTINPHAPINVSAGDLGLQYQFWAYHNLGAYNPLGHIPLGLVVNFRSGLLSGKVAPGTRDGTYTFRVCASSTFHPVATPRDGVEFHQTICRTTSIVVRGHAKPPAPKPAPKPVAPDYSNTTYTGTFTGTALLLIQPQSQPQQPEPNTCGNIALNGTVSIQVISGSPYTMTVTFGDGFLNDCNTWNYVSPTAEVDTGDQITPSFTVDSNLSGTCSDTTSGGCYLDSAPDGTTVTVSMSNGTITGTFSSPAEGPENEISVTFTATRS